MAARQLTSPSTPATSGLRRPRSIPPGARARPGDPPGSGVDYVVGRRLVARVHHHSNGRPAWELHFDAAGRLHGVEREHDETGRLRYRARWSHGLQVGDQLQWDARGRLIVRTRFVRGTGLDLWYCGGGCWEERHLVAGARHGVERLWIGTTKVSREERFERGLEHGISRDWEGSRLRKGFPRYFVRGERVGARDYERARRTDPALPARTADDDRPTRTAPPELLRAAARSRGAR